MDFIKRFQGRTSTMTKQGYIGLVVSSKNPIAKRSSSPSNVIHDESVQFSNRPTFYKAPVIISKDKDFRHGSIQHHRMSTEPTYEHSSYNYSNINTQNPRSINIQPNKTILVHNGVAFSHRDIQVAGATSKKNGYSQDLPQEDSLPSFKTPQQSTARALSRVSWSIKPDPTRATFSHPGANQDHSYRAKSSNSQRNRAQHEQQREILEHKQTLMASKQMFLPKPTLEANSPMKRDTVRNQTFSQSIQAVTTNNRFNHYRDTSREGVRKPYTYREEPRQTPIQGGNHDSHIQPPDTYIAQLVEANVIKYLDKLQNSNSNFQYKSNSPLKTVKSDQFPHDSINQHSRSKSTTSRKPYNKKHTVSEVFVESGENQLSPTLRPQMTMEERSPSIIQKTPKASGVIRPQRATIKSTVAPTVRSLADEPHLSLTSHREKFYSIVDDFDAGPKLYFNAVLPHNKSAKDLSPTLSTKRRLIEVVDDHRNVNINGR